MTQEEIMDAVSTMIRSAVANSPDKKRTGYQLHISPDVAHKMGGVIDGDYCCRAKIVIVHGMREGDIYLIRRNKRHPISHCDGGK